MDIMNDKEYYEMKEAQRIKHLRALSKARYRGEMSVEWHIYNKLTKDTQADFNRLMKSADKEWEEANELTEGNPSQ